MTLKYVIFKAGPLVHPVFFPEHVVHSMVWFEDPHHEPTAESVPGDFTIEPHSAGFFYLNEDGVEVDPSRTSESLKLGPKPYDKEWIERALAGMGTTFFVTNPDGSPML